MPSGDTLTSRGIAFATFGGVAFLAAAELGLHALFVYKGIDDGGTVKDLLTITVGSLTTAFGMVVGHLFGSRAPN